MNGILEGFGLMLKSASLDSGNWGYAILVMAVIIKLATYIMTQHEIRTLQLTPILKPKFDAIEKRHKNNKDEKMKEILVLGKQSGYKMFAGIGNVVAQIVIMGVIAWTFFYHGLFLSEELSLQFLWMKDISVAPFQILLQNNAATLYSFLYSMILPAFSYVMYHFMSQYIAVHSLIDKTSQQKWLKLGIIVLSIMTPQAVGLYLATLILTTLIQYAAVLKFSPLSPKDYEDFTK